MADGMKWDFEVPGATLKNDWMKRELYEFAAEQGRRLEKWHRDFHIYEGHPGEYGRDCKQCYRPVPWYRPIVRFIEDWWPTFHFGPCDHSECA